MKPFPKGDTPNKALQRTRSAPLRSPLSFKPLDASWKGRGAEHARSALRPALAECFGVRSAGASGGSSAGAARPFRLNGFRPMQAAAR